ncbi:MAG: hypothetical protein ACTS6G_00015 [Candidatus Hodgkinia cicadicola]
MILLSLTHFERFLRPHLTYLTEDVSFVETLILHNHLTEFTY